MIKVEHLTKRYGNFTAVDDVSFEINESNVYGFLGPNGAGKSTTMNIMTGCLSATKGRVIINGYDIFENPKDAKKLVGYLPEQPPLYQNETPYEYLTFVGESKGLKGKDLKCQINKVIEETKINDVLHTRIQNLSKGYKQRVGIAQALLGNPDVIILDEPTVGLDPIQIREIRELIRNLGTEHTVLISSHILSEIQNMCEKIIIISHGKLIAYDEPNKLEEKFVSPNIIKITTDASVDETKKYLSCIEDITCDLIQISENGYTEAKINTGKKDIYSASRELFVLFASKNKVLYEMSLKRTDLEELFVELTGSKENDDINFQEVDNL